MNEFTKNFIKRQMELMTPINLMEFHRNAVVFDDIFKTHLAYDIIKAYNRMVSDIANFRIGVDNAEIGIDNAELKKVKTDDEELRKK